jgi:hypothetical protein
MLEEKLVEKPVDENPVSRALGVYSRIALNVQALPDFFSRDIP